MVTIKDIAELSGYSIGTVSRVINNHPDVSQKARDKIDQVIREKNFRPNSNARGLKQVLNTSISIIVRGFHNMFFEGLLEQVQADLRENGEDAEVSFLDENADEVQAALEILRVRKPKGFIFLGGNLEYFRAEYPGIDVPSVLLTNTTEELDLPGLSSFTTDDERAAGEVIRYLLRMGHRRIGIIGGSQSRTGSQIGYRRLMGCEKAFQESGIPFDLNKQYEPSLFSMQGGYDAARKLLHKAPDITAIFAIGDTIAIGAMRAIRDQGLCIPQDISIIGYDGIEESRFMIPRLATIRQDTEALAMRAAEDLLFRLNYRHPVRHEYVPFELVEGESVRLIEETPKI